jgi:hypothetical protein
MEVPDKRMEKADYKKMLQKHALVTRHCVQHWEHTDKWACTPLQELTVQQDTQTQSGDLQTLWTSSFVQGLVRNLHFYASIV